MTTELVDVLLLFLKYLRQDDDGMKNIMTWFYNAIMKVGRIFRPAVSRTSEVMAVGYTGMGTSRRLTTVHGDLVLDKPQFREEGSRGDL